jgi:hypothetical protein
MDTNTPQAANGSNGAGEVREHVNYLVGRTNNFGRLRTVERLLAQPGSRVFVPQSEAGIMLFNRLLDLDIVYAAAGRQAWRASTADALSKKQRLEGDLHELNQTLIQIIAQIALTYGLDTQRLDATVVETIRAAKARAAAHQEEGASDVRESSPVGSAARYAPVTEPQSDAVAASASA